MQVYCRASIVMVYPVVVLSVVRLIISSKRVAPSFVTARRPSGPNKDAPIVNRPTFETDRQWVDDRSGVGAVPLVRNTTLVSVCRTLSGAFMPAAVATSVAVGIVAFNTLRAKLTVSTPAGAPSPPVAAPKLSHRAISAKLWLRLSGSMQYPDGGTNVTLPRIINAWVNGTAGRAASSGGARPAKRVLSPSTFSQAPSIIARLSAMKGLEVHVIMTLFLGAGMCDRPEICWADQLRIFPKRTRFVERLARSRPCRFARCELFVRQINRD